MTKVNLYEAKTSLSQLVERAAQGEDIVIAKNGRPMAALVSLDRVKGQVQRVREFGFLSDAFPKFTDAEWEVLWREGDEEVARLFEDNANRGGS
jgi:prevent-host-death family protein